MGKFNTLDHVMRIGLGVAYVYVQVLCSGTTLSNGLIPHSHWSHSTMGDHVTDEDGQLEQLLDRLRVEDEPGPLTRQLEVRASELRDGEGAPNGFRLMGRATAKSGGRDSTTELASRSSPNMSSASRGRSYGSNTVVLARRTSRSYRCEPGRRER